MFVGLEVNIGVLHNTSILTVDMHNARSAVLVGNASRVPRFAEREGETRHQHAKLIDHREQQSCPQSH
jgi:hypothetical protein